MEETRYWSRLSRRQVLRGSAVVGLGTVGAALIGCSGGAKKEAVPQGTAAAGTPTAIAASQTAKKGGTLRIGSIAPSAASATLDSASASSAISALLRMFVEHVQRVAPAGQVVLDAAHYQRAAVARAQGGSPRIWQGVYSEAQAARGKDGYTAVCLRCHAPDLAGVTAPALKEAREKRAKGQISAADLTAVEDREIERVIKKQEEVGLKSVTDGEFRRSWWHFDFFKGLKGVTADRKSVV